jgi:hypothetical protein
MGCISNQTNNSSKKTAEISLNVCSNINFSDVEWITKTGGLPGSKWKVLFAQNDIDTIKKIVGLINAGDKTEYNSGDYGHGKVIGYPVIIAIKLKNGDTLSIEPLFKVTTREFETGIESIATAYDDRVLLKIEGNSKEVQYTLPSEEMAKYLLHDSDKDIPFD